MTQAALPGTFAYRAQTRDGVALSGTIEARDVEEASLRLKSLQLHIIEIEPSCRPLPKPRAIGGDDFLMLNQQLAQLTAAGLPVDRGLRLIAQDIGSGRLAATVRQIAEELEKGKPLEQAFAAHQSQFPGMYWRLIEAGVRSNNLPGILFGLSRHLELVGRLKSAMWRSFSYPLMVLAGLCVVIMFLGWYVLPQVQESFAELQRMAAGFQVAGGAVGLPWATRLLMFVSRWLPLLLVVFLAVVVLWPLLALALRRSGGDRVLVDRLALPLPVVGPVLKANLLAGWCNALRLGVEAGLDLPAAIGLAGDASRSPALAEDGRRLTGALEAGATLEAIGPGGVMPATVPAAIALGMTSGDLPTTLAGLSEMYQRQAENRLALLPGILTPLLLLLIAGFVGLVLAGVLQPLAALMRFTTLFG